METMKTIRGVGAGRQIEQVSQAEFDKRFKKQTETAEPKTDTAKTESPKPKAKK